MRFYLHNFRRPSGKLFFPAGWLALGLFPLLGFSVLFSDSQFHSLRCTELTFLSNEKYNETTLVAYKRGKNVIINGATAIERARQLDTIYSETARLAQFRTARMTITLGENATWQDFIRVLDFLKKECLIYEVNGNRINVFIHPEKIVKAKAHKGTGHGFGGIEPVPLINSEAIRCRIRSFDITPNPTLDLLHSNRGIAFLSAAGVLVLLNVFSLSRKKKLPYSIPVSRTGK